MGNSILTDGRLPFSTRSSSRLPAVRAMSLEWIRIVVSGGEACRASSESSNPMTDTSSGTRVGLLGKCGKRPDCQQVIRAEHSREIRASAHMRRFMAA